MFLDKMIKENEVPASLEWRVNMPSGSSRILAPESRQTCSRLQSLVMGIVLNIRGFLDNAWNLAVNEPKKVVHCLKVGLALSLVSVFYYMRPLYDGVGGNAMWAVMTVVVVFEYTVGEYDASLFCPFINSLCMYKSVDLESNGRFYTL